ncbi:MAG TPA: amino acid ABC transporter substrate-binding protein [Gaiellaceae bacterium]|nr:amino acid ABC transporter substrate-binding protein [Gaiellaceae bacterium]
MRRTHVRLAALAACAALAALATTAGAGSAAVHAGAIKIGISLSLSGDFSDPGKFAEQGYKLWAKTVNAKGGILGRQVQLIIQDDASSPTQAATNYQNFITKDHVDLVFGPFSTLLTAPSAAVASRYGYAFIEPAGGGPAVFDQKLHNVFFTQPAPIVESGDVFVKWVLSLPKSQRPKTAAYPALDDPFSSPIADRMRQQFEKAGVKTVYKTIYPSENVDMTPIVSKIAASNPDMVVGGTQAGDGYALVKGMVQAKFSPKFLFLSNGPNSPGEFPSKVGAKNTEGIFSSSDWFPQAKTYQNPYFIKQFLKAYGGKAGDIDPGSAEAFAVGQVAQRVIRKVGLDNAKIIAALHQGTWPTVEGTLHWNSIGEPTGQFLLVEWLGGHLYPVLPKSVAVKKPTYPKPGWGG